MQHFFVEQELENSEVLISDSEILHQMKKVLRFAKGDECVILDGKGGRAKGRIEKLDNKAAVISLSDREKCEPPQRKLTLYCALSKKPAIFEIIVQKATELGVTDIVPLVTERCQVNDLRKTDRLKIIIREAAEQCERCFLPELHEMILLKDLLADFPKGRVLAGDARVYDQKLGEMRFGPNENINLIIGPEGGLTDAELTALRKAGATLFLLGENILRMETAAIAAVSVVLFGDKRGGAEPSQIED